MQITLWLPDPQPSLKAPELFHPHCKYLVSCGQSASSWWCWAGCDAYAWKGKRLGSTVSVILSCLCCLNFFCMHFWWFFLQWWFSSLCCGFCYFTVRVSMWSHFSAALGKAASSTNKRQYYNIQNFIVTSLFLLLSRKAVPCFSKKALFCFCFMFWLFSVSFQLFNEFWPCGFRLRFLVCKYFHLDLLLKKTLWNCNSEILLLDGLKRCFACFEFFWNVLTDLQTNLAMTQFWILFSFFHFQGPLVRYSLFIC